MGVQSARFFAESISKPLHLTNCHLYMRSGMDHAFPIFPCFDKVIKPVLGSFPRFCPQLSFEQGCGVPPKLKESLTEETWNDWENRFGFSHQLLKTFPKPKNNQAKDIENYLNKRPEYRSDEEIQEQILSFFPLIILEVVAKDTQIPEGFHEKIKNRCRELQQSKSSKIQKDLSSHKKNTSAKNKSTQPQDLIALLKCAKENKANNEYLRKIDILIQNIEDDYQICNYLNRLVKTNNQDGFNVLMDAVVNVSGEEKVANVAKLILAATFDTEELKSMYTKYVAYVSTEKVKSQFNFGDFIDTFFKDPINRETRNFLSNICERVSEMGKEGCRQARIAQLDLAESNAKNTDEIIDTIGESLSDLESCIINMSASEETPVKDAAGELIDKIECIHKALGQCGMIPVTDFRTWAEQEIVAYDGEIHDIPVESKTNERVKLNSIGLKSQLGKKICRAKVRSVQGDDTQ